MKPKKKTTKEAAQLLKQKKLKKHQQMAQSVYEQRIEEHKADALRRAVNGTDQAPYRSILD